MPLFHVKKSQSGQDSWGDSFEWQHEFLVIEAPSMEQLQKDIEKIGRPEVYANEFLNLELVGVCDTKQTGISLRDFLSAYEGAVERLDI